MRGSRIIPIALVLIIIAIAIAALISLARAVFFSDSSGQTTVSQVDVSREALLSTAANRSVKMTVRGAIVADEQFRSYQITITPSSRTLTTYMGYLDTKIDEIVLSNNIPAYEEFVYALNKANFIKGTELTGDKNDIRGICATGRVYEFAVLKELNSVKSLWTSTCKDSKGSLSGNYVQLTALFISQIPKGTTFINKIDL